MSVSTEEYMNSILKYVASAFELSEWHYSLQKFEVIAQNYFGILIPAVLRGKRKGKEVDFELVLKLAPTDERYRVSGALTKFFSREIFVYSVLLKRYEEIQARFLSHSQYIMPKCYYVCREYCNEVIVMEDMRHKGYKPYTHEMFLDFDHIIVSLKSLAKFHALSFILQETDEKLYEEVVKACEPLTEKNNKRFMDILVDRLKKLIKVLEGSDYLHLIWKLKDDCVKFIESMSDSVKRTCICHGDIWKENILFQYEDNKPVEACLIDYQTTRMGSPAFDALYLITTSTDTNLRCEHFDKLLDIYYQTFDQFLTEANLKSELLYSFKEFQDDLKTVAPACFIVANTALWLSNGLQEEGHVRSKQKLFSEEEKNIAKEQYRSIINNIILDYYSYGYFSSCC